MNGTAVEPKKTAVAEPSPVPWMTTGVPPAAGPSLGVTDWTVMYVYWPTVVLLAPSCTETASSLTSTTVRPNIGVTPIRSSERCARAEREGGKVVST